MKYLKPRNGWYHFERVVPPDVRHLIDQKEWRHTLDTDSKVEAEARCRRRTVETDEQLKQAKNGTYRRLSQMEIENLAAQWGIDFQLINRENIAREAFPDVWGELDAIGDEAPRPIIRKKSDLAQYVADWLEKTDANSISTDTPDFEALLDACLDEYLVSNPEISNGWEEVLTELSALPEGPAPSTFGTLKRTKKIDPKRRLSVAFNKYLQGNPDISDSAVSDFGTGVRRFIEFCGDLDVEEIDRTHAEKFRDGLLRFPSRPPNKIRVLSMQKQLDWAETNETNTLQRGAVNKNLQGVKLALDYAYSDTSLIKDRTWRNPFEGFIKKVKQSKTDRKKGFTDEQVKIVFSREVFRPKTVERFWIPVVLFYTGARLDEISQLHVSDVKYSPVPHLLCENLEDEDPALAKLLKNETSHRTIPIPDELLNLGFLDYAEAVKASGHVHLFPNLPHKSGKKRAGYVSRTFMEAFREHGERHPETQLNTLKLRTHSLRHTYRRAAFNVPDQDFVKIVMGHYVDGESIQTYGWEIYNLPDILIEKATKHVKLPALDLHYLRDVANKFLAELLTSD